MNLPVPVPSPVRMAILAASISHFEVPLFRLLARESDLAVKVFYLEPAKNAGFDTEYAQTIDWGVDLLSGYESKQLENVRAMERAAREWGADVFLVCGYGWQGAPALILRNWFHGVPQIHRGTLNYHRDPRRPVRGRLMRPFGRFLLRLFDAHHYGGDYSRKVLTDAGAESDALFFVPYSVDTPYFIEEADTPVRHEAAKEIRRRLGWTESDHVILFIAQHNWFKGPDIAMATFAKVAARDPSARFLVVGSGRMTEDMKATAAKTLDPQSVHFAGFVPSTETISYYLASDLVICSSRYETWARMVNEAMLCCRPCIVSKIVPSAGGLIEQDVNGLVVDMPEAEAFALAIRGFFERAPEARAQMGNAARERAKYFAYEPHLGNAVAAARHAVARHGKQREKAP